MQKKSWKLAKKNNLWAKLSLLICYIDVPVLILNRSNNFTNFLKKTSIAVNVFL